VEDIPGLENLNVTELVNGHMAYRSAMPKLLREVGWEVTSDEFTEIEDPDPENHAARQRELIKELDEARKDAEAKPEKKRFAFFKRGKVAERKAWETYDERNKDGTPRSSTDSMGQQGNVLFDIDAIRRELQSEQIDVKELKSTLPPMKIRSEVTGDVGELNVKELVSTLPPMQLNLNGQQPTSGSRSPRPSLRQSQSSEAVMSSEYKANSPQQSLSNGYQPNSNALHRHDYSDYEVHESEIIVEENIQMTFDSKPSSAAHADTSRFTNPYANTQPQPFTEPISQREFSAHRPELRSHSTEPNAPIQVNPFNLEHNAWADEDEDFGKEKEMKMTFE
jgi:hypothetical protein